MDIKMFNNITKVLLDLGFKPMMKGFDYLREAILIYINKDKRHIFYKDIYPEIAQKYNVSSGSVERYLRIIIKDAYQSGGLLGINEYYKYVIIDDQNIITASEIVAIIAEIVEFNKAKINN